jgi:hypothetical protein
MKKNPKTATVPIGGDETMTPYAVIRTLNKRYGTTYPTQMGYNYVRNNLIPARKVDGKWTVSATDAEAWIEKFATKNKLVLVTK